ncbi:MAG: bacteriohemerythrin [Treponema sp.]|nr:bacteriohemerythrin [Treponema sp.]
MMVYKMDDSFMTGCKPIDDQHKRLVDSVNGLVEACSRRVDRDELQRSLDFLSDYTIKHFFDEEQILKKYHFSGFDSHYRSHEAFKKSVRDFSHDFILRGASEEMIQEVEDKIGRWLIDHIKGQDMLWAEELRDKAPEVFAGVPVVIKPAFDLTDSPPGVPDSPASAPTEFTAVPDRPIPAQDGAAVMPGKPASVPALNKPLPDAGAAGGKPSAAAQRDRKHSTGILVKTAVLSSGFFCVVILLMAGLGSLAMREFARKTAVMLTESDLKENMTAFKRMIAASYGEPRLENGQLLDKDGTPLLGRYEVVDKAAGEFNAGAEIFVHDEAGFTRIASTLTGDDGKRAEGTAMDTANAALESLLAGETYAGEVMVLSKRYIGSYEPVFASPEDGASAGSGEVIGALFVGVEISRVDSLIDAGSRGFMLILGLAAAGAALASIFVNFILLKGVILKPVEKIAAVLKRVEDGDISQQIRLRPGDEIGEIAGRFNRTLENVKRLVMVVRNEAEAVDDMGNDLSVNMAETAEAAREINAGIQHMRRQISAQAGSVRSANTAMEKIIESVDKLNSEIEIQTESVSRSSAAIEEMLANIDSVTRISRTNSDNVSRLAEASEVGRTGLEAVAAGMHEIARESEGLLEINSVLQNIASQTNLLSMNAAIEAAHAGDAGRGFAVVAGEIRKLAESSSAQSKTISAVLKKIKDAMAKISAATGEVLNKFGVIDSDVKTVACQEEQIRNAMEEQSAGSRRVLEAMEKLNDITRIVKNSSEEMRTGSKAVIEEGKVLEKVTAEITGGMKEIAGKAEEVSRSVDHVNDISRENKSNIVILKEAASRFVIADEPPQGKRGPSV